MLPSAETSNKGRLLPVGMHNQPLFNVCSTALSMIRKSGAGDGPRNERRIRHAVSFCRPARRLILRKIYVQAAPARCSLRPAAPISALWSRSSPSSNRLRDAQPRCRETLQRGISDTLGEFKPEECANELAKAGYAST